MDYNHAITMKLFDLAKLVTPVNNARLCAAVVYKGKIVGLGVNSYKTHPRAIRLQGTDKKPCIHAEMAAIFQAQNSEVDLSKCDIYVVRAKYNTGTRGAMKDNNEWVWGVSKPCEGCMKLIREVRIKNVICLTEEYDNFQRL